MNGTEDCGKAEGNGKNNEAGLINTWNLEGILGATSRLDCSGLLDGRAPSISNVTVDASRFQATITWTTDERTTTGVGSGEEPGSYTQSALDLNLETEHVVVLDNLEPATDYHFEAGAEDYEGNLTGSGNITFRTKRRGACGLGFELALLALPALLRRRRRGRA